MATGFFGSAVHLGVGLSLLLAGLLGENVGWRPVFFSLGAVGVCLSAGFLIAAALRWPPHPIGLPGISLGLRRSPRSAASSEPQEATCSPPLRNPQDEYLPLSTN